jgi:multidrug efflux pump subunit AcrB
MLAAVALVYIVLVISFGSLLEPFAILFSLPMALIGALLALVITQRALGLPAMIGILMLIGIVVTNAIVLIDLVNQLRKQGYERNEALIIGGRTRLRPILMTAVATILALMPLALGLSEGAIIAAELGTVVIGGLFSSTLLTLVVVPVVYSLLEGFKGRLIRKSH